MDAYRVNYLLKLIFLRRWLVIQLFLPEAYFFGWTSLRVFAGPGSSACIPGAGIGGTVGLYTSKPAPLPPPPHPPGEGGRGGVEKGCERVDLPQPHVSCTHTY